MQSNKILRKDIQALRGLAVLSVVLFHVDESLFSFGYLGVDAFFVISGFVVTPLIMEIFVSDPDSSTRTAALVFFFRRRFYRLAPALMMMLFVTSILLVIVNSPETFRIFGQQSLDTILLFGNYGAFKNVGDYFTNSGNPLIHTWSLAVEEQIYLLLPLVMCILIGRRKSFQKSTIVIFVALTSLSLFITLNPSIMQPLYSEIAISDAIRFSFYSPIHRLWQFTIGGLGYLLTRNRTTIFSGHIWRVYLPSLIFTGLIVGSSASSNTSQSLLVSVFTLSVLCFRTLEYLSSKIVNPLIWIGDRSYSIYLYHMPLIYFASTSPLIPDSKYREILVYISAISSFLFGAMSFSLVEKRFRINQDFRYSRSTNFKLLSSLTVINLLFSAFLISGSSSAYWGLERKTHPPIAGWNMDTHCARMSGESASPCTYSSPGFTKTVLLVGDSHAAQFSQAVVESAAKSRWNSVVWTMPGCNFALRDETGTMATGCLKKNRSVVNWIDKNKPNIVIVSQYNKSGLPQSEMKNAVLVLKERVKSVLVVGNTPIFPDRRFLKAPAIFQKDYIAPRRVLVSEMNTSNSAISEKFLESLANEGVDVVNLNSLWCSSQFCERFEGDWLYTDTDHLSMLGASKSVPYFSSYLQRH